MSIPSHPTILFGEDGAGMRALLEDILHLQGYQVLIATMVPEAVWPWESRPIRNRLPEAFGEDSTVHRHFQQLCQAGIFDRLWPVLVEACDELQGVDWKAADTAMGKARMGGALVGRNPTDWGKKG